MLDSVFTLLYDTGFGTASPGLLGYLELYIDRVMTLIFPVGDSVNGLHKSRSACIKQVDLRYLCLGSELRSSGSFTNPRFLRQFYDKWLDIKKQEPEVGSIFNWLPCFDYAAYLVFSVGRRLHSRGWGINAKN
jgi:hypothetical protein